MRAQPERSEERCSGPAVASSYQSATRIVCRETSIVDIGFAPKLNRGDRCATSQISWFARLPLNCQICIRKDVRFPRDLLIDIIDARFGPSPLRHLWPGAYGSHFKLSRLLVQSQWIFVHKSSGLAQKLCRQVEIVHLGIPHIHGAMATFGEIPANNAICQNANLAVPKRGRPDRV